MQKRPLLFAIVALISFSASWAQCPDITIDEKYNHTPSRFYSMNGWDTAISCENTSIVLSATPFITAQHFNGTYVVEEIEYNPPEPFTFGTRMPVGTDDDFGPSVSIEFPFCFFGQQKTAITLGANGLGTFTSTAHLADCPWQFSDALPWPNATDGTPSPLTNMRDAIYGVYEDTYPPAAPAPRGIYYGASPASDYPCRHICFSWNHLPQYNHSGADSVTHNCSYQIAIFEGTNIIEVHVKDRMPADSWNGKRGIIGIQNATGATQVSTKNDPQFNADGTQKYTNYIEPNSPGFFAPAGFNYFTTSIHERAWRFTPQGSTIRNIQWWKLLANGDSVEVGTLPTDANALATEAYYLPNTDHMSIQASPTETTRYMVSLKYTGATGHNYYICDTITIGMDTANTMNLLCEHPQICQGQTTHVTLYFPISGQSLRIATWNARHVENGIQSDLPESRYQLNSNSTQLTLRPADSIEANKIDTTIIYCTATFHNGCSNFDSILILTYPNFDLEYEDGICEGQTYTFGGNTYNATGDYTVNFQSQAGCDSVEHLHLTVFSKSHNVDKVDDCKPFTWTSGNGMTYYESNYSDSITLQNRYGCDSIVRLEFTLHPLTAKIVATPENATMDVLNILLTDASINGDSRTWYLPDGNTARDKNFQYSYPVSEDSVEIKMHAVSQYGCEEDASIVIHMLKETFWIPNAFTPSAETNNLFRPYGIGLVDLQMSIFDRRGVLVYRFKDMNDAWDGKDMNGNDLPQGSYTYIVHYKNLVNPDKTNVSKGTITLIR